MPYDRLEVSPLTASFASLSWCLYCMSVTTPNHTTSVPYKWFTEHSLSVFIFGFFFLSKSTFRAFYFWILKLHTLCVAHCLCCLVIKQWALIYHCVCSIYLSELWIINNNFFSKSARKVMIHCVREVTTMRITKKVPPAISLFSHGDERN